MKDTVGNVKDTDTEVGAAMPAMSVDMPVVEAESPVVMAMAELLAVMEAAAAETRMAQKEAVESEGKPLFKVRFDRVCIKIDGVVWDSHSDCDKSDGPEYTRRGYRSRGRIWRRRCGG